MRAQIVQQLPDGFVPYDEALEVIISVVRSRPKSTPKKVLHPIKKPDIDNFIKAVLDSMNGVVFRDDSLIIRLTAEKSFGDTPQIIIQVKPI